MHYAAAFLVLAASVSAQDFTSIFNITATPEQVVNNISVSTPGQAGASGQFNYALNSRTNTICYDITLNNVSGSYQSPALTATHIHQGNKTFAGPARIAFPNPAGNGTVRRSSGCLTGPFVVGLRMADNVTDAGAGFTVAHLEANPSNYFTDSHTNLFPAGVVRGQLDQSFRLLTSGSPSPSGTGVSSTPTGVSSTPSAAPSPFTNAASVLQVGSGAILAAVAAVMAL